MTFLAGGPRSFLITTGLTAALSLGAAGVPLAAGLSNLELPPAGTYSLDRIQKVPFSVVQDESGFPHLLSTFATGKVTLLTFFYSQCADPQGCPLAWSAFESVRQKIKADPGLHGRARLVFYSFDPVHDTSSTLQLFAQGYKADANIIPWRFITAWNDRLLRSTLDSFGQDISPQSDARTDNRIVINHLLKVFLIDRDGYVREIYTSAFLDPNVLIADVKTLVMEENKVSHGG